LAPQPPRALGDFTAGPRAGWADLIGARIVAAEEGSVVVELDASEKHHHPGGVVQGGIITAIADAAMGISLMTAQPADQANTTIELKINFIRPVTHGRLRAIGKVVEIRKSLLFSEADVYDEEDRLVAHATSTCIAIPSAWPAE
jgi:uncharacterized protein (TIGR00369 family)